VPANAAHQDLRPVGIGRGLRVKVNANIGTAPGAADADVECQKMQAAVDSGADTLMDLSLGATWGRFAGPCLRDVRFRWERCRSTKPPLRS
jgi:thiamine biosynthesis protein ThiC